MKDGRQEDQFDQGRDLNIKIKIPEFHNTLIRDDVLDQFDVIERNDHKIIRSSLLQ